MKIGYGCLVSDIKVLEDNLLQSPIDGELKVVFSAKSASIGLNQLLQNIEADIIVLCHQDVIIPDRWGIKLKQIIETLPSDWGLLGVWGARIEDSGFQSVGNVFDTRLDYSVHFGTLPSTEIDTIDELCLIIHKGVGFIFDEKMTGFDLYGTYATLRMKELNRSCYIIDNLLIHNSKRALDWYPDERFLATFDYLKNRFPNQVVLSTSYHGAEHKHTNPVFMGKERRMDVR